MPFVTGKQMTKVGYLQMNHITGYAVFSWVKFDQGGCIEELHSKFFNETTVPYYLIFENSDPPRPLNIRDEYTRR